MKLTTDLDNIWADIERNKYKSSEKIRKKINALIDSNPEGLVDETDSKGRTLLHMAATIGDNGIVQQLIDKDAKVDKANNSGNTPLIVAATMGQPDVVKHLLDNGANVNATNNYDSTALSWASRKGHSKTEAVLKLYLTYMQLCKEEMSRNTYNALKKVRNFDVIYEKGKIIYHKYVKKGQELLSLEKNNAFNKDFDELNESFEDLESSSSDDARKNLTGRMLDKYTITDFEAFNHARAKEAHARAKEAWENSFLYKVQKFFKKILSKLFGANNKKASSYTGSVVTGIVIGIPVDNVASSAPSQGSVQSATVMGAGKSNTTIFSSIPQNDGTTYRDSSSPEYG